MNFLQRIAFQVAKKAYTFSTSSYRRSWYDENGYRGISAALGGANVDRALQLAALYGGVKIIGEDMGSLPLHTSRRTKADEWERDEDHALYSILHDEANPETTAMEFREAMTATAVLCGVSHARIVRNFRQEVTSLWQIPSGSIRPDRNQFDVRYYHVKNRNGVEEKVSMEDIFVLRGFGVDGESGADLLHVGRQAIGLADQQNDYANRYFSNNQKPPFYVAFPNGIGGAEGVKNFKEAWKRDHEGPENWNVPAVLQEGGTIHDLRPDNEKAQLIEQRRFQISEICRLIRLSPHKLADLERATFSNIENLNIHHYTETLRPYAVRWEQAIRLRLLRPEERKNVKAEHAIEGFLRGDFRTQTEGFARLLEKGVYSINDVRRFLGQNPIEGGDEHYVQLNMSAVGQAAAETEIEVEVPSGKKFIPIRDLPKYFPKKAA